MGRFRWYVTTTEDETEALKAAIALSVTQELGTVGVGPPPSPHPVPGGGGKRLYLDPNGGWNRYRHYVHGFPTKEAAETHAFGMTTREPNLVGNLSVEKLWYEPPEIDLSGATGVVPSVTDLGGMSDYLTEHDLAVGKPILKPLPFVSPPCKPGTFFGKEAENALDLDQLKKKLGLGPKRPHDPLLDDEELDLGAGPESQGI